jgi:hypothetical protein
MSWKVALVVQTMRDELASRARRLVDDTRIYEQSGLSPAQVHDLVITANQFSSPQKVEQYTRAATERSQPKDLTSAERGKGEAWKKACPASYGEGWQFFGERLQEEVRGVVTDARNKARSVGADGAQQQTVAMACLREFCGYLMWYFVACKNGLSLPATRA